MKREQASHLSGMGAAAAGANRDRRKFLTATALLGAATITSPSGAKLHDVFEIPAPLLAKAAYLEETVIAVASIGSASEFKQYRTALLSDAIDPFLKRCWNPMDEPWGDYFWVLRGVTQSASGKRHVVLDYSEFDDSDPLIQYSGEMLQFKDWLQVFHPQTWDDYLMAYPLYCRYKGLYESHREPLPSVSKVSDPWLQAFLKRTRGMLIWRSQKQELARVVTGSRREAERLISGYYRRQPDAIEELGQLRYEAEGSTLIEIIEMLQPDEWLFGEPDYLIAECLQIA